MDDFTGVVLDKLDELGIADDTIVIWASDNGADTTYHYPAIDPDPVGVNGTGFSAVARRAVHGARGVEPDALHRSMAGEGTGPGRSATSSCNTVDWFTTLLNVAGANVPDDRIIDGMDLRDFRSATPRSRVVTSSCTFRGTGSKRPVAPVEGPSLQAGLTSTRPGRR